ncbi:unnamed protein product [Cunninghamella echinulata]
MSEDKKRKQIQETTANIFQAVKKREYSNLSFEKVVEYLGIDYMILFTNIDNIPTKEMDKNVIERITEQLVILTKACGAANEGNEFKRQEFVFTVIVNIIAQYYDKNIKVKREKQIEGEDIKEPVEFVITRGKLILIVIEAKKQDWEQGRAQLFMELYNAYIKNIKFGAPKDHIIYGIVTTGYSWEFIWCKGKDINNNNDIKSSLTWKYEETFNPIEINLKKKREQWKARVAPLVYKINYMIDHSLSMPTEQLD